MSHHGNRPVAQADELPEAARLVVGGHHEEIGAGIDAVRERVVETDHGRHLRRVLVSQRAHALLVVGFARAEQRELHVEFQQVREALRQQVEALLPGQPGDQPEERNLRRLRQTQLALQRGLAGHLAPEVPRVVVGSQITVGGGIPFLVVNPVEHAEEVLRAVAQHALKSLAIFRRLNLLRVSRTHGAEQVGKDQPALHEVHLAVELQRVHVEQPGVEAEFVDHGGVEDSLVSEVVNSEEGGDVPEMLARAQPHGDQRGLPIIAVNDLRLPVAGAEEVEYRAAEDPEAKRVVRLPVEGIAMKVFRRVHQVGRHARNLQAGQHPD